jgi:NADH-quinone oxidoreductase subunit C
MNTLIRNRFGTDEIEVKRDDLSKVTVVKYRVFELIHLLVEQYGYTTLNAITCADLIEEVHFAITYMLTTRERRHTFMVQTMIGREEAKIDSLTTLFPQAEIMERDLHEMYGIDFPGNGNLVELSLENWVHTPPLRREFDTLAFVNELHDFREGRDDNLDVKAEMKRLRALKKAAKEAAAKKEAPKTKEKEEASQPSAAQEESGHGK